MFLIMVIMAEKMKEERKEGKKKRRKNVPEECVRKEREEGNEE